MCSMAENACGVSNLTRSSWGLCESFFFPCRLQTAFEYLYTCDTVSGTELATTQLLFSSGVSLSLSRSSSFGFPSVTGFWNTEKKVTISFTLIQSFWCSSGLLSYSSFFILLCFSKQNNCYHQLRPYNAMFLHLFLWRNNIRMSWICMMQFSSLQAASWCLVLVIWQHFREIQTVVF